jgi:PAS domain S-box-containing protein
MANCLKSNHALLDRLDEPGESVVEECDNGLVDCAFPIIIKGKHVASLATGQLLTREPDLERFREQARLCGFDEAQYLQALSEIPVVPEEKLRSVTMFLGELALIISQLGYSKLVMREEAERLRETEDALRKAHHKLEIRIQEREAFLAAIVESSQDAIIGKNLDGTITFFNAAAERIYGYSAEEIIGKSILTLVPDDSKSDIISILEQISRSEIISNHEALRKTKDGRLVNVSISMSPIKNDLGEVVGASTIAHDITDHKQLEREREQLILKLQEAIKKVKTLSGFLPICASCKKIRDDHGYWRQIECYIRDHSDAEFSHSICPECSRKLYPEFFIENK